MKSLIVARRSVDLAPKERWKPDLSALPMHDVLRSAFLAAAVPVETNFARHGATVGRNHRGLAQAAGDLVASWRAGRGQSEGEAA
jgi:hypothetical protein